MSTSCRFKGRELWVGRCVDFNADLGHVELLGGRPTQTPAPTRAPLPNCVPLTGRYLAHWQVSILIQRRGYAPF